MSKTQDLYRHAKHIIPGGVQLLSKRPEQFAPDCWPAYAAKAKGCEVWDLDGNHYYDMTSGGIGACLLGYADPDVNRAVISRIENGSMSTLNCAEEAALADRLLEIHPWAECVRFARTGGETCAIAVRIARAATGRDIVLVSGYHGWSDWYLAANLADTRALDGQLLPGLLPAGVPKALSGTTLTFRHGDTQQFDELIRAYGDRIACVIMEPLRHTVPDPDFLPHIRDEAHRIGALLIFDEITIGWRFCFGGSHRVLGVEPDFACFAKALGNGHPIGAVIGRRDCMDAAQTSFISSTYWTEGVGYAAALAAIDKMEKTRVWEKAARTGEIVKKDWNDAARRHGVAITEVPGVPCLAYFDFPEHKLEMKTLYTVLMLREGFLGNTAIYPTLAHTDDILALHREALDRVFSRIGQILQKGGIETVNEEIGGRVCQSGFKRLVD